MRTPALVTLCLVVIPAGVFVWATSEPTAATPSRAVFVSTALTSSGLHPVRCTSHGNKVTCTLRDGEHCNVTFEPDGVGRGSCASTSSFTELLFAPAH